MAFNNPAPLAIYENNLWYPLSNFVALFRRNAGCDGPSQWLLSSRVVTIVLGDMLFHVEGTQVFLFGSIHLGREDFYPVSANVEQAFQNAERIVFEADLDADVAPYLLCPNGSTLRQYVSAKIFNQTKIAAPFFGLDFEKIRHHKPWAVALQLSLGYCVAEKYTTDKGVDRHFLDRCKQRGSQPEFLETLPDGFRHFDTAPVNQQQDFLSFFLFQANDARRELKEMFMAWRSANQTTMEMILSRSIRRYPFFDGLIHSRNHVWLPKIERLIEGGQPAFVCVGALHFIGTKGIPNLLRQRGYRL
jgi:uncharacterized protein YbaP (TraB family)